MNARTSFLNALDRTDMMMKRFQEQSDSVRLVYISGNLEKSYLGAMKLEEIAEKLVLQVRTLPAYTGVPFALPDVEKTICASIPTKIGFTAEGWFSLRIPLLLPKKSAGSADYIRSFLYPAMRDFFIDKKPIRYTDCILIYRHVYDRDRPERRMRDHDNIEVNMVSDIVAMYVMPDDGPSVCSHYYCSACAKEERTEVYVVPKSDFPLWLATEKAMPDKGVDLYEKIQI